MTRGLTVVGLVAVGSLCVVAVSSPVASSKTAEMSQYISPQECVRERIDDGVSRRYILTPDECRELIDGQHPVTPQLPTTPEDSGRPGVPNTGAMTLSRVIASDAWWTVLFVILMAAVSRLYRYIDKNHTP